MHAELVTGGAQVEAGAHRALRLLDRALDHDDPTAAGDLIEGARDVIAGGLGLPRRFQPAPWDADEEGDRAADEQHNRRDRGEGGMTLQEWTARRALVLYMSELSERYWCAGWLDGWELRCRPDGAPGGLGGECFDPAEQHTLRLLSEAAGGWWPGSYDEVAAYEDSPLPPDHEEAAPADGDTSAGA